MITSLDSAFLHTLLADAARDGITKLVVGAVIANPDGEVLLLHRQAGDYLAGLWELPSGGVDEGETLIDALGREVNEETGLTVTSIGDYLGHFDYRSGSGRPTRQFNFAATTTGDTVTLTEHDAHSWTAPQDSPQVSSSVQDILDTWRSKTASSS
ncbi:NUDIX hydrolase [Saccharopolyspora shandongensis]|uniref:NUDIX hydrolase n=1 Tax=Saccharopolyspora shandongensis TaxID=418495 RepID=UPI0033E7FF26